jgi:hypothetical protein
MRKLFAGLATAAALTAGVLAAPSPASADPSASILKCRQSQMSDQTIAKSQYWSCAWGQLRLLRASDYALLDTYDGNCANSVWQRDRSATFYDMQQAC